MVDGNEKWFKCHSRPSRGIVLLRSFLVSRFLMLRDFEALVTKHTPLQATNGEHCCSKSVR